MVRVVAIAERVTEAGARSFRVASSRPGLLSRILALGFLGLAGAVVLAIALPLLVVGTILAGAIRTWFAMRSWSLRARQPGGALDGRHNVRVRVPDAP